MTQPGALTPAQHAWIRIHLALIPVYGWLLVVWTAYAIDISPAGRLDRSGHIKGHDFAHFYVLGQIANDRAPAELYDFAAQAARMDRLVPDNENPFAPFHGPHLALFFAHSRDCRTKWRWLFGSRSRAPVMRSVACSCGGRYRHCSRTAGSPWSWRPAIRRSTY